MNNSGAFNDVSATKTGSSYANGDTVQTIIEFKLIHWMYILVQ